MTHTHRLWALLALVLILVLAACSTPADLNVPTLEPQFGSADDERGIDVASISTGRIYLLSEQFGPTYGNYDDGTSYQDGTYSKVLLKRQDGSGNIAWSIEVASAECSDKTYPYCSTSKPLSAFADTQGNINVLMSRTWNDPYIYDSYTYYTIRKYSATGNYITEYDFYDDDSSNPFDFAVDGSGNSYIARKRYLYDNETDTGAYTNFVAKYSASGALLWQRTSTVGTPYGITVSSTGSVYVVGTTGVARYSSSGGLTWSKAVNNSTGVLENAGNITLSGSYIYTRSGKDIRKWDSTGKQLWLRTQSGLNTIVVQDIDGDGSGNLYVSGKYDADGSTNVNMNAYMRKLSGSGSILWTKTYGTSAYDDARGVATITGSEIYTTGETQGSLAHTNIGGRDGYLRKQNSTGGLVWNR